MLRLRFRKNIQYLEKNAIVKNCLGHYWFITLYIVIIWKEIKNTLGDIESQNHEKFKNTQAQFEN